MSACNCIGPWGNCPCVRGRQGYGYYGAWWGVVPPPGWYYYGPPFRDPEQDWKIEWERARRLFDESRGSGLT